MYPNPARLHDFRYFATSLKHDTLAAIVLLLLCWEIGHLKVGLAWTILREAIHIPIGWTSRQQMKETPANVISRTFLPGRYRVDYNG